MNNSNDSSNYYNYKQIFDNNEEIIQLRHCFVDLGQRVESVSEEYISSDEDFKYFGNYSDTESYDSERDGFHLMIEEFNRKSGLRKEKKPKKMTKKTSKSTKRGSDVIKTALESSPFGKQSEEYEQNIGDHSLLGDDFYEKNMNFFMSQSLQMTQMSSAIIKQNGRFAYYHINNIRDQSLKVEQNVDHLLIPLTDLIEESESWPLILKTITEYMFAFRKSSPFAKCLAHKLLAHYNWSEDNYEIDSQELSHIKRLHFQFLDTFMQQIILNCYSRQSMIEIIGGSDVETNAWPFVSKLITYLVNESIRKSDSSLAFTHLKRIVELLVKDFQQFLNDSEDYCVDIQRIERHQNYRPLICRLIWPQKTANYLNSVLKQLIFLIIKVIKINDDILLIQLFKLFEISAESFRIGSGNVRPYTLFSFDRPTPITELFQQLIHHSLASNELFEKLLDVSNVCWIKVQLCAHFMAQLNSDSKIKYLKEKKKKLSLKLIVECLMNATNSEDSPVFVRIVIDFIVNYIETTKLDRFLNNSVMSEGCVGQELWPNIFFEIFQRDINECDISSLIEDLSVLRNLTKVVENIKTVFVGSALDLFRDLDLMLSVLKI